jgi:hypothetical protein
VLARLSSEPHPGIGRLSGLLTSIQRVLFDPRERPGVELRGLAVNQIRSQASPGNVVDAFEVVSEVWLYTQLTQPTNSSTRSSIPHNPQRGKFRNSRKMIASACQHTKGLAMPELDDRTFANIEVVLNSTKRFALTQTGATTNAGDSLLNGWCRARSAETPLWAD